MKDSEGNWIYCANDDEEATCFAIKDKRLNFGGVRGDAYSMLTPLCKKCRTAYEWGQANPNAVIAGVDDVEYKTDGAEYWMEFRTPEGKRPVDMGVAWTDGTWDQIPIYVPVDTPAGELEALGRQKILEQFASANNPAVSAVWVDWDIPEEYWALPETEEDDD